MPPKKISASASTIPDLDTISSFSNDELGKWLVKMATAYYKEGSQPIASDEIYDAMKELLETRDPHHPALTKLSHAGIKHVFGKKNKMTLPFTMGSLDKIKADPAVLSRFIRDFPGTYLVSDKLDGISALFCENSLYTRGNGVIGHDISNALPYLRGIPSKGSVSIVVRGELLLSKVHWSQIESESGGSNPRNVVAGIMNAKTPDLRIMRLIDFVAYEVIQPAGLSPSEQMALLQTSGFHVVEHIRIDESQMNVEFLSQYLVSRKANSPFVVDGVVVYHDQPHSRNVSGNPDYAFAFKSLVTQDQVEATVGEVEWNVSKDGLAKPIAKLAEPVVIDGVEIRQATLFNAAFVETHRVGPGSRVIVIRAGDVIPHILRVVTQTTASFPTAFEWAWNATHVDIIATAPEERALTQLIHFFDKIDAVGVSEGVITKLYENGYTTVKAILGMTVTDFLKIEGFKEKLATKLTESIRLAMSKASSDPVTILVASNAFGRGFGKRRFDLIFSHIPDMEKATVESLIAIPGIEEKTATAFLEGIPRYKTFVRENRLQAYLQMQMKPAPVQEETKQLIPQTWAGKTVVFTGFRDAAMEAAIEARGGRVGSSLSGKTTYLVVGDKPGSKADKAKELGIPILTRAEFEALIKK